MENDKCADCKFFNQNNLCDKGYDVTKGKICAAKHLTPYGWLKAAPGIEKRRTQLILNAIKNKEKFTDSKGFPISIEEHYGAKR